jgi:hypothetical protein
LAAPLLYHAGDAKIVKDGTAVFAQQYIIGLYIPMDNALLVGVGQSGGNLQDEFNRLADGQPLVGFVQGLQMLFERLPLHKFHHQKVSFLFLAKIINMDDMAVAEAGDGPRLLLEPRPEVGIDGQFGADEFEGHVAVEARLVRLVHLGHAAFAQFLYQLVLSNGLPS